MSCLESTLRLLTAYVPQELCIFEVSLWHNVDVFRVRRRSGERLKHYKKHKNVINYKIVY